MSSRILDIPNFSIPKFNGVNEYDFMPQVDRFRRKWSKPCKNCGKPASKIVVIAMYDIREIGASNGKSSLRRKQEFFIEYLLCSDCLADIKHRGALLDSLGGKK